eukprot:m.118520 g.118520  ORF g.118520 m.118520 type:complete len:806 (+) comp15451_c2_seq1:171-2588(+)
MEKVVGLPALLLVLCAAVAQAQLQLQFGGEISGHVQNSIRSLVNQAIDLHSGQAGAGTLVCGNTSLSRSVISDAEINSLNPEGYIIRSVSSTGNGHVVAARGQSPLPLSSDPHYQNMTARGSIFACYAALQQLGFAFLHPLRVEMPLSPLSLASIQNTTEQPRWRIRGFHIHTEHPLELTDLLTGFDISINGSVVEKWEDMLPDFERYLQWSVANRLNRVEWLTLYAKDWDSYAFSAERKARFKTLTDLCHAYATHAGVDAAIAEQQQHAMTLVDPTDLANATAGAIRINQRMQWLSECGFDFLSTENGLSEFTHPNDKLMLYWINATALAAVDNDMTAFIKCHISSGQFCKDYVDPDTGKPLNFNYLPILSDEHMGIMPHTVQYYNYQDPVNTYGNANFTEMFEFMFRQLGKPREIVYHPETAYWVNYDINAPLFLPLYALGRVGDLRYIKETENQANHMIDGHVDFDSGWEWGYWLQDVALADMFWDVCTDAEACADDTSALAIPFGKIARAFGDDVAPALQDWLLTYTEQEHELLVYGRWNRSAPLPTPDAAFTKLDGQAYLQGWDAIADLAAWATPGDATQPAKLTFSQVRLNEHHPDYWTQIRPLLETMNATFGASFAAIESLQAKVPAGRRDLFAELIDSAHITFLRARLVYALYDYAATWLNKHGHDEAWREGRLSDAKAAITEAIALVEKREQAYRVPLHRIAAWRSGPTSYRFGYLWSVHSLYFFWRDYAIATIQSPETLSPCFRNIQDVVDVGIGEGMFKNVTQWIYDYLESHDPGADFITDCLDPPTTEPHYSF